MTSTILVCLGLGFVFGVFVRHHFAGLARKKLLVETTKKLQESGKTQDHHYAIINMSFRDALREIEGGNVEVAKKTLGDSIATFYNCFSETAKNSDLISNERREVERQSKSSEVLRLALNDKANFPKDTK